jgi:hypothetical protein
MPPTEAFDLSLSVSAHLASMAASRERAIGRAATSDLLGLGDEITWRAWHFGGRSTDSTTSIYSTKSTAVAG